jgi:hypothetical protein
VCVTGRNYARSEVEPLPPSIRRAAAASSRSNSKFQYFQDKESVTAAPTRPGFACVVWQDARFSGHDEIAISTRKKTDGTWTPTALGTKVANPHGIVLSLNSDGGFWLAESVPSHARIAAANSDRGCQITG